MFKSNKQRASSHANAQKSTGPRTAAGKAVSRFNALKHAIFAVHQIMFDEKPEDLAELADEYHELYIPADGKERFLVGTLVNNEWRLRRMRRVEAVLWEHAADAFLAEHPEAEACNSAHAFATNAGYFERQWRGPMACILRDPGRGPLSPRHPRNPNNPHPVPRIWLRSIKIRKPHLQRPLRPLPSRRSPPLQAPRKPGKALR
jgi:hypothetical protein